MGYSSKLESCPRLAHSCSTGPCSMRCSASEESSGKHTGKSCSICTPVVFRPSSSRSWGNFEDVRSVVANVRGRRCSLAAFCSVAINSRRFISAARRR